VRPVEADADDPRVWFIQAYDRAVHDGDLASALELPWRRQQALACPRIAFSTA
jgi:hypothetical protein